MKSALKTTTIIFLVYALTCLITPFVSVLRMRAIENQITYLSELLDNGYDNTLQERFPEGKMFSNAILALSIIEYSDHYKIPSEYYATIVDKCVIRILSNKAQESFDETMIPEYGMFYNGWALLVINTYTASSLSKLSEIKEVLTKESLLIEQRLLRAQSDSLRILESYSGLNWPADNLIGLTSLKNKDLQKDWLEVILKTTQDPDGLIHHTGFNPFEARGSSSAMITYCLGKISPNLAKEYNESYRNNFIDSFLGADLVLEHKDRSSSMDIDTGPVILGYGASATVMNVKTQGSLGQYNAKFSWAFMNLFGLPVNLLGHKYYLLKQEPMLDLFLLWGAVEL